METAAILDWKYPKREIKGQMEKIYHSQNYHSFAL